MARDNYSTRMTAAELAAKAECTVATAALWMTGAEVRGNRLNATLQRLCPRDPTTLKPIEQPTEGASK